MANKIAMLMVVVVVAVICGGGERQCALADAACDQQVQALSNNCYSYVAKGTPQTTPSAACCTAVKATTVACACSYVTPLVEAFVDANKVVYVASYCGLAVPHGTKCGSKFIQFPYMYCRLYILICFY